MNDDNNNRLLKRHYLWQSNQWRNCSKGLSSNSKIINTWISFLQIFIKFEVYILSSIYDYTTSNFYSYWRFSHYRRLSSGTDFSSWRKPPMVAETLSWEEITSCVIINIAWITRISYSQISHLDKIIYLHCHGNVWVLPIARLVQSAWYFSYLFCFLPRNGEYVCSLRDIIVL